jgi:heptosyltransferase-3
LPVPQQTDLLKRLAEGSRVAIIRLRSLGDCVLSTPAIALLQASRPDLEIAVVAEDRFASLFDLPVLSPSIRALRAFAPALCLNLHGGTRSARLTALSGASERAGFDIFKPAWIYNVAIPTAQEVMGIERRVHTAEHMAAAMFHLGVPVTQIPRARIPAPEGRSAQAPAGGYAVVHAFAATPEKTWPAANFLELAGFLRRSAGLESIFIGAAGDDLSRFQRFPTVSGASLPEIARLVRDASLFIGNDSGPAHMAAAFGLPELVFFGPSDEAIWRPWRTEAEVLKADPIHEIDVDSAMLALQRLHVSSV